MPPPAEAEAVQPLRLRRLLGRLIDIYSPSGKEGDILAFIHGYLKRRGLPVERQEVDEHRCNLLVLPVGAAPRLVMLGHVDTVPAYDLDHFASAETDGRIRGLGAADMKGGCAAMIEAFVAFLEKSGGMPPAALALVVGEEEDGDGAARLIRDHHFPWAVIGEPTDLTPCLSHSGYLEVQVRTRGRRRHASLSSRSENAVAAMLTAILAMTRYLEQAQPEIVYNIRDLFSARAGFVVPERCEAWLDLHLPPSAAIAEVAADLEGIFCQSGGNCNGGQRDFRITTIDAGYSLPHKGPVLETLTAILADRGLPAEPRIFRSHSDANQIWAAGIKPVLLGPGRLEQAHVPEESVSFGKVCQAAAIYHDILTAAAAGRW
jgi:acetylornithine deacetylase